MGRGTYIAGWEDTKMSHSQQKVAAFVWGMLTVMGIGMALGLV